MKKVKNSYFYFLRTILRKISNLFKNFEKKNLDS
jgi:hypothetical protein